MRFIFYFLVILTTNFLFSQEICNNAIDDDGDGLVDLNDTLDCSCLLYEISSPISSLIPNPSFENTICCPTLWGQMNCAITWIQASNSSTDYFNLCGFIPPNFPPQFPIPNGGNGFVGFVSSPTYKEYLGACLNGPLQAGTSYTLSFYTAYRSGVTANDLEIFGTSNCSDMPWTSGCPVGLGGWQSLGIQNVVYDITRSWQQVSITFTPSSNINAISIGGSCLSSASGLGYYYIDELILNTTSLINSTSYQGSICRGDSILSFSLPGASNFQWYKDKIALVGEVDSSLNALGYGLGEYSISFDQIGICNYANFSLNAPAYPTANATVFFDSICEGETAIVLGDTTLSNVYVENFYFSFQDGSPNAIGYATAKEYETAGNYNIYFVVETNLGCKDSIAAPISVFDKPDPQIEFSANGNLYQPTDGDTITVCGNDSLFFNNLSTVLAPSTILNYEWDFGDLTTSSLENPAHQFTGIGVYDVSFILETNKGCNDTLAFVVDLLERPSVDFVYDTNYCENQAVSLINSSSIVSSTISSYNWDFGDQNQSNAFNPLYHYSTLGNYSIKLVAESVEGCKDSIIKSVVIHPLPISNFLISGYCEDDTIIFTDQSTVTSGLITSWQWNFGDGGASNLQDASHLYNSTDLYLIDLVVVTDQGCRDTLDSLYTISPSPQVNFLMSDQCENEAIEIDNVSTLSSGTMTYSWTFQNNINSILTNPPSFSYPLSGQYSAILEVTSDLGCLSINTQTLTIHEVPNVSILESPLNGCSPFQVTLSQTHDNIIDQCIWDFGDGTILEKCGTVNHVFEAGIFDVELTVISEFGCESSILQDGLVSVTKTPEALFRYSPQIVSVKDNEVKFINESLNASSYIWSFGSEIENSLDTDPTIIFPKEPGTYAISLTALSDNGLCQDETIRIIKVHDDLIFYVPNSFTPDGNGSNEEFNPVMTAGIDVYNYQLIIYNRWGEILLISKDPLYGWDGLYNGEQVSSGIYIWRIDYSILNLDEVITEYGTVNLIR